MTHNLTDRQKAEWLDIVIERDEGYSCWYCKKPFSLSQNNFAEYSGRISPHLFDHLNNNRQDNRIDNVVLCCESCNNKKPHDSDMQILATDKLHDSEKRDYMREKFTKKARNSENSEVQISKTNYQICLQYVAKKVDQFGQIDFKETILNIVWKCRENNNTGSPQATRNYLNIICCISAPFEITKIDGKKIIHRRVKSTKNNSDPT